MLMNVGCIWQHDATQVARGRGGVDIAIKAALAEMRQIARVVDMRVGKHHAVDLRRIKREVTVALQSLRTSSLIQSAIQQDASVVDLNEVFRSRRCSCRSAKGDFHGI